MPRRPLDETDRQMIAALHRDARQSHQSIASTLGVSEGTVRSRLKQLEADGVLRFTTIQNIDALNNDDAFAYLWIACDRTRLREIGTVLSAEPLIGFVASILGRADLLAVVHQRSPAALASFVDDVVKRLPCVADVRTEPSSGSSRTTSGGALFGLALGKGE